MDNRASMSTNHATTHAPVNSPRQVLFASLIGTTIEFFDVYIYATAAVLVFPRLFFPATDPASATLASLATFGIAFLGRARSIAAEALRIAAGLDIYTNDQLVVEEI
jgi:hypothetical protein